MTKIDFHIFKGNTDAIATNRGFYYQYLKTLDLWLDNFINGKDVDIFCEREDDIFEKNEDEAFYAFRQIKCYSGNFGLNSDEIKGSLLHFYSLYKKHNTKECLFYFETNSGTKPKAGKTLLNWYNLQQKGDFSVNKFVKEVKERLESLVNEKYNKYLKGNDDKSDGLRAKDVLTTFKRDLSTTDFTHFLEKIRWEFSGLEPDAAILNLKHTIFKKIGHLTYEQTIDDKLVFGFLLNKIVEKSVEPDKEKRLLDKSILENIPSKEGDLINGLRKEVQNLILTNFQILETFYKKQYDLANKYAENGFFKKAVGIYLEILEFVKKHPIDNKKFEYFVNRNLAYCYDKLGNRDKWAKWTNHCLELRPNEPMNLCEAFIANEVIGNAKRCTELYNRITQEFPNSEAFTLVQIHILGKKDLSELEAFEKNIPAAHLLSYQINYGLANAFRDKGILKKFKYYLEKVIPASSPQMAAAYKASLAYKISISITGHLFNNAVEENYTEAEKNDLEYSARLYEEAWNYFKENNQGKSQAKICINTGAIYMHLGFYEKALKWIEEGLSHKYTDFFHAHKVMVFLRMGDAQRVIKECKKINFNNPEVHFIFLVYMSHLLNTRGDEEQKKAIELAYNFLNDHPQSASYLKVIYVLIEFFGNNDRYPEAEELLKREIDNNPDDILLNIAASKLYARKGDKNNEHKYLEAALECSTRSKTKEGFYELGKELFSASREQEAIGVLLKIEAILQMPMARELLLDCYMNIEEYEKALGLCQRVRQTSSSFDHYFASVELGLLLGMKDYKRAIPIAERYSSEFPDDIQARFKLCNLYLHAGKENLANKLDLNVKIDSDFPVSLFRILGSLLLRLGRRMEVLDLSYKLWRVNKSEEACMAVIQVGSAISVTSEELKVDTVRENTGVFMKNRGNVEERPYILYNHPDAIVDQQEINKENKLYEKLVGAKVGDRILWGKNMLGDNYKEVTGLITTYQFAYLDAIKKMGTTYDSNPTIYVGKGETPEQIIEIFNKLGEKGKSSRQERINYQNELLDAYSLHHKFTLGGLETNLGRSSMVLWHSFTNDKKIGIQSDLGEKGEKEHAYRVLSKSKKQLCLTPAALMAMYSCGIADTIIKKKGKFIIPQSVVDHINQAKLDLRNPITHPNLSIYNRDKTIRHRFEQMAFDSYVSTLDKILPWIKEYCIVQPIKMKLSITQEEQKEDKFAFGKLDYDSILVAKANDNILICDDFISREYGKMKFGIPITSSQYLLKYLRDVSKDSKTIGALNSALLKLIELNYRFIGPDSSLMLYAAQDDEKFDHVLQYFDGSIAEANSAITTSHYFTRELWASNIAYPIRKKRTHQIMDALTNIFPPERIYNEFSQNNTASWSLAESALKECIEEWWKLKCLKS